MIRLPGDIRDLYNKKQIYATKMVCTQASMCSKLQGTTTDFLKSKLMTTLCTCNSVNSDQLKHILLDETAVGQS